VEDLADAVVVGLRMPHCDGVEAIRHLRDHDASIKVLVLTTYTDDRSVIDALRWRPQGPGKAHGTCTCVRMGVAGRLKDARDLSKGGESCDLRRLAGRRWL
jgi:CheY-like chemotaxis protein